MVTKRKGRTGVLLSALLSGLVLQRCGCITMSPSPTKRDDKGTGVLGDWASNATRRADLARLFSAAHPYPHVVIDDFFSPAAADRIERRFPVPNGTLMEWKKQGWHIYDNPIEGKLAHDDLEIMGQHDGIFSEMWDVLQGDACVDVMKSLYLAGDYAIQEITGIQGLENDPHLHGGGLHYHPPGSRLEMHLDYSIHPISKKERRVNLIIYMNRGWREEWGGHLALWEGTLEGLKQSGGEAARVAPVFNRAVLFRTSDVSWHGMPDPVKCPDGEARKSIAIYYMSDARPEATPRYKASYRPRPGSLHPDDEAGYAQLCRIRERRRLEHDDVKAHLPNFKPRWALS